jgi:hypothetical protein
VVEQRNRAPILNDMEYRGIEYTVVQGIGRQVWKWSVSFDAGAPVMDQAAIKSEAVAEAERASDRAALVSSALSPEKTISGLSGCSCDKKADHHVSFLGGTSRSFLGASGRGPKILKELAFSHIFLGRLTLCGSRLTWCLMRTGCPINTSTANR